MKLFERTLKVAIISSAFLATVPLGHVAAEAGSQHCFAHKAEEKGFFSKLNRARRAAGRSTLNLDRQLTKVARKHTKEMVEENLLHHTSSPALRRRVTHWQMLGENVGVGNTVDSLHVAFMNSPGHKANIMYNEFRHVGIGTRQAHGRLWVTVIFEAESNPGTTLFMSSC